MNDHRAPGIAEEGDGSDRDQAAARHSHRVAEAGHRLHKDPAARCQQHERADLGGENLGPREAEAVLAVDRARSEDERPESNSQSSYVGDQVDLISEQRQGVEDDPADDLDAKQRDVDGESPAESTSLPDPAGSGRCLTAWPDSGSTDTSRPCVRMPGWRQVLGELGISDDRAGMPQRTGNLLGE